MTELLGYMNEKPDSWISNFVNQALPYNNQLMDLSSQVYNQSQELWAREDSAYQRMVADMKKAGLNPWTGVSSGGLSAGSNIPAMDSLTSLLSVLTYNLNQSELAHKISYDDRRLAGMFANIGMQAGNKLLGLISAM